MILHGLDVFNDYNANHIVLNSLMLVFMSVVDDI